MAAVRRIVTGRGVMSVICLSVSYKIKNLHILNTADSLSAKKGLSP